MTGDTESRVEALAGCSALFEPWTGCFDAAALRAWLTLELGSPSVLDEVVATGATSAQALAPRRLLHVLSGNTPHASAQSLLRGLLLGSHNVMKLPTSGLPALETMVEQLPPLLRSRVDLVDHLPEDWASGFNALTVYGSDETIAWFAARVSSTTRFVPHGQRLSIALVRGDVHRAAHLAARDVGLHDQRGCLSVHDVFVAPEAGLPAPGFAELLAGEMASFEQEAPRSPLSPSEAGAITNLRETVRFVAASQPDQVRIWHSDPGTAWTVISDCNPAIAVSCLNRVVFVKPWPEQPAELGIERRYLAALALHPFSSAAAERYTTLGATRICALGTVHDPPLTWHHDGILPLASLVSWVDVG